MKAAEIEIVYEALAKKIDIVGKENSNIFLAKLILLLAKDLKNLDKVLSKVDDASLDLNR